MRRESCFNGAALLVLPFTPQALLALPGVTLSIRSLWKQQHPPSFFLSSSISLLPFVSLLFNPPLSLPPCLTFVPPFSNYRSNFLPTRHTTLFLSCLFAPLLLGFVTSSLILFSLLCHFYSTKYLIKNAHSLSVVCWERFKIL